MQILHHMQSETFMTHLSGEFEYRPDELVSFTYYFDAFNIRLKNGDVVRYHANEPQRFYEWLTGNGIKVNTPKTQSETTHNVAYLLTPPLS